MTTFLIIFAVIILIALVYLFSLNGNYNVDRSLLINAPIEKVYQTVVDFKSWPKWSPWLLHEPDTRLVYSDNYDQQQGYYSWDGKIIGEGKLTHQQLNPHASINQQIEFIRPFKSVCAVNWHFKAIDGKTGVHWTMQGYMPFFLRFMTKMTVDMITKDYDLGLHLLNGYLDNNNPHPRFRFHGPQQLDGFSYICKPFKGNINAMKEMMGKSFPELANETAQQGIASGLPLTVYHKAKPQKNYFECDIAVPVNHRAEPIGVFEFKSFEGGKYYKVECQGDYQFLELAWYKAISHLKMLKTKIQWRKPFLEVYENDPRDIEDSNEIRTSLFIPVR